MTTPGKDNYASAASAQPPEDYGYKQLFSPMGLTLSRMEKLRNFAGLSSPRTCMLNTPVSISMLLTGYKKIYLIFPIPC
jgi:steroid 5-alpha reductase family enzyme